MKEHIAEYGGDPDYVVISGGSAGGHLASLAALTPNQPEYQPGFEAVDTTVQACVPFYGVYDFTNRDGIRGRGMGKFLERTVMKSKLADGTRGLGKGVADGPGEPGRATVLRRARRQRHAGAGGRGPRPSSSSCGLRRDAPVVYAELPGAQHAFEIFRPSAPCTSCAARAVARLGVRHPRRRAGAAGHSRLTARPPVS